jgi:hypothetical protein
MRRLTIIFAFIRVLIYVLFIGLWNGNNAMTTIKVRGKYVFIGLGKDTGGIIFSRVTTTKVFFVAPEYKDRYGVGHVLDEAAEILEGYIR